MSVRARFYRRGAVEEEDFDSIEDAVRFLAYDEDAGTLASDEIRDGDRVVRNSELDDLVNAADENEV